MRFSIKAKLGVAFGLVLLLTAATAYEGVSALTASNERLDEVVDVPAVQIAAGGAIKEYAVEISRFANKMMLTTDDAEIAQLDAAIPPLEAKLTDAAARYRAVASDAGRQLVDEFGAAWQNYKAKLDQTRQLTLKNTNGKAYQLATTGGTETTKLLEKAAGDLREQLTGAGTGGDAEVVAAAGGLVDGLLRLRLLTFTAIIELDDAKLRDLSQAAQERRDAIEASIVTLERRLQGTPLAPQAGQVRAAWTRYLAVNREVVALAVANETAHAAAIAKGRARRPWPRPRARGQAGPAGRDADGGVQGR
jgi:methyl-accepting chemotaxis protein